MKEITRKVIFGDKLGGKILGFPTANLRYYKKDKIKFGVWAILARDKNKKYKGVAFVGSSYIFGRKKPKIEVHLFNFRKNLYGKKINVKFVKYLRKFKKFNNTKSLIAQIEEDCKKARKYLTV